MEHKLKIGDLVTGKDRSYTRSIYRVAEIHEDVIKCKLVSFRGNCPAKYNDYLVDRMPGEDRLATEEEVHKEMGSLYTNNFKRIINRLLGYYGYEEYI